MSPSTVLVSGVLLVLTFACETLGFAKHSRVVRRHGGGGGGGAKPKVDNTMDHIQDRKLWNEHETNIQMIEWKTPGYGTQKGKSKNKNKGTT